MILHSSSANRRARSFSSFSKAPRLSSISNLRSETGGWPLEVGIMSQSLKIKQWNLLRRGLM